jgi:flagellar basal-body rod protein FlgC
MDSLKTTMSVAGGAMRAQSLRIRLATENLANADSAGYQRRTVEFGVTNPTEQPDTDFVAIRKIARDSSALKQTYDPNDPRANQFGYVIGSNVNSVVEVADAREASRSYEAATGMFEQAKSMYAKIIDMMRS